MLHDEYKSVLSELFTRLVMVLKDLNDMRKVFINLSLIVGSCVVSNQVLGVEGGYSNYIPGTYGDFAVAIEPATKLTLRNDTYFYQADDAKSVRSGQVEIGAELSFILNLTTLLYKPDITIFGAQYAFGALIPLVHYEIESGFNVANMSYPDKADASGLGDVALVPLMLYWNQGNLHTSFGQYIIAPTGDYSTANSINAGLNHWSFDTNLAVTHLNFETGREYSVNLGHIYNTENSDTDYQSGRELHIDYSFNQFLSETFAIGVQGFYWRQISDDTGSGAVLGGFRGKAAGIGPAILWTTQIGGNSTSFIVKWIHEFDTERRIKGDHFMASFALGF